MLGFSRDNPNSLVLPFIGFVILGLLFFKFALDGEGFMAGLALLPIILYFINKNRWLLPIAVVIIMLIVAWFFDILGAQGRLRSIAYFLILSVLVITFIQKILTKNPIDFGFYIFYLPMIHFLIGIMLRESYTLASHMLAYLYFFSGVFLYLVLINSDLTERQYKKIIWCYIIVNILNIPVNIYQLYQFGSAGDAIRGIFAGTIMSIGTAGQAGPCIFASLFFTVRYIVTGKGYNLLIAPLFIIPIALGQNKGGYFILGASTFLIGIFYVITRRSPVDLIKILAITFLFFFISDFLQNRLGYLSFKKENRSEIVTQSIFDMKYISDYNEVNLTADQSLNLTPTRVTGMKHTAGILAEGLGTSVFGYGLASATYPSTEVVPSKLYLTTRAMYFSTSDVINIFGGVGFGGIILCCFMNVYFFFRILFSLKFVNGLDVFPKEMVILFWSFNLAFLVLFFYSSSWIDVHVSNPYFVLAAIYYRSLKGGFRKE